MSVNKKAVTFEKATEVRRVDSHTYEVNLEDDWCIGTGELSVIPFQHVFVNREVIIKIANALLSILISSRVDFPTPSIMNIRLII